MSIDQKTVTEARMKGRISAALLDDGNEAKEEESRGGKAMRLPNLDEDVVNSVRHVQ